MSTKRADLQDLQLKVTIKVDDEMLELDGNVFDVSIIGSEHTATVHYDGESFTSTGDIYSDATIDSDGYLHMYMKGSEVNYGGGMLQMEFVQYADNTSFKEDIQVIRTIKSSTGIYIVE